MPRHGGEVVSRVRRLGADGGPLEVQVLRLPDEAALSSYTLDPERLALAEVHRRPRLVVESGLGRLLCAAAAPCVWSLRHGPETVATGAPHLGHAPSMAPRLKHAGPTHGGQRKPAVRRFLPGPRYWNGEQSRAIAMAAGSTWGATRAWVNLMFPIVLLARELHGRPWRGRACRAACRSRTAASLPQRPPHASASAGRRFLALETPRSERRVPHRSMIWLRSVLRYVPTPAVDASWVAGVGMSLASATLSTNLWQSATRPIYGAAEPP